MGLGRNGFVVRRGDLVRVVSQSEGRVPSGTVAVVGNVLEKGQCIQLAGHHGIYVPRSHVEVVSYVR